METWQSILLAIGGNTALVAVLAWLAKSLIAASLTRDIEQHKSNLALNAQEAIDRLRHQLQLAAQEHQVTFSKLQERRAKVVAKVYALLVEAFWQGESLASPMEWAGEPSKIEKYSTAMNAIAAFYRYFDKHRIYLPDTLCKSLEALIKDTRWQIIRMGGYVKYDDASLPREAQDKKFEVWDQAWDHFKKQVPEARAALERELRVIIGDTAAS